MKKLQKYYVTFSISIISGLQKKTWLKQSAWKSMQEPLDKYRPHNATDISKVMTLYTVKTVVWFFTKIGWNSHYFASHLRCKWQWCETSTISEWYPWSTPQNCLMQVKTTLHAVQVQFTELRACPQTISWPHPFLTRSIRSWRSVSARTS